jgi:hypothetical protein
VRVTSDHPCSSPTNTRSRVASHQTDGAFADTLASAVEASESDAPAHPPELSAATYRLFAAIDLERGDTKHAALHLSRVPDAREAGVPLQPTGLLSDVGRWDYTEAAAALPETGRFDTASGQGERTFIPYNARTVPAPADDCAPSETAAAPTTPTDEAVDRLRGRLAPSGSPTRDQGTQPVELRAGIEALLQTLAS